MRFIILSTLALLTITALAKAESPAAAIGLRCEYRVNPLGIGVAVPRLNWIMQDHRQGAKQAAYRVLVASTPESLARDEGDLWDSGSVESDRTTHIEYAGKPLDSRMQCYWKVRIWDASRKPSAWSRPACWTMGLLHASEWQAKWITDAREAARATAQSDTPPAEENSAGTKRAANYYSPACPLFRKPFRIDQPVRRAALYASALGNYQLTLNGQPVGKDYFTPDWTDYGIRVYYNSYDVTQLVRAGDNALGATLGAGWYAGAVAHLARGHLYGDIPKLLVQLEVELADGSRAVVASDGTWTTSPGPVTQAGFLAGETYDATREIAGWASPGTPAGGDWQPALVAEDYKGVLQAFPGVTVQKTAELTPIAMTQPQPGAFVFDMGQNFAGVARLRVRGPRGTRVTMRFAERLNPDGTIYTANLLGARCTDVYILKGDGEEVYQPRFTYRGYQYVELTGLPGVPDKKTLTGIALNSAIPPASEFECSSAMVNKLYSNICWTQRANYVSVPTDCPQRDERLGWTGDAEVFIRAGTYNADAAAFFTKWLVDLDDAQTTDGQFPSIAPQLGREKLGGSGAAAWADAGTICPMTTYGVYGDRRLLEQHYPAMVRWVEYCRKSSKKLLRPSQGFGDWLAIDKHTPKDVLATAYFARSCRLVAEAAEVLGKKNDAQKYGKLSEQIKAAFEKAYVASDGRIKGDTQTCYVLALAFELLTEKNRAAAAQHLADNIRAHDNHLTTGFVGTGLLLPALSRSGGNALAYRLLLNDTYPSWGFQIKHGATSTWENWNGWTPESGFFDPHGNSFAHYAFGAVNEWMFCTMAGIDFAEPGYKTILLEPQPGPGIDWVKASYRSINGTIGSAWKKDGDRLLFDAIVPANTRAVVRLPVRSLSEVTESGKPLAEAPGVTIPDGLDGKAFELEAGEYHFAMSLAR